MEEVGGWEQPSVLTLIPGVGALTAASVQTLELRDI